MSLSLAVDRAVKFDGDPRGYVVDLVGPNEDSELTEPVVIVCTDRETSEYVDLPARLLRRFAKFPVEVFTSQAIELARHG